MYVKVDQLADVFQSALKSVEYHKKDILIIGTDRVEAAVYADKGKKGFIILVDFLKSVKEIHWGSWGGSNMFTPNSPVDNDTKEHGIPKGGAVIKGEKGYNGTYAVMFVNPADLAGFLPEKPVELTDEEKSCLYCFRAFKGGEARKEELRRRNVSIACINKLVNRGFLKQNKVGATQITTEGKNAIGDWRGY